jgi:tubulin polyglutamylase TTLL1
LINRRKFDIRVFALVTSINGNMKAYFYEEGYLRTSSREFSMNNLSNKLVHLTNDAIQKQSQDYGKYECGNKMSYVELQAYLDKNHTSLEVSVERDLIPQMKKLTSDCIKASWGRMDPNKRVNTFEVSAFLTD